MRMIKIDIANDPGFKGFMIYRDKAVASSPLLQRLVDEQPLNNVVGIELQPPQFQSSFEGSSNASVENLLTSWRSWLYNKRLGSTNKGYRLLTWLYELGIFLEDAGFQHAVIDAIFARDEDPKTAFAADPDASHIIRECFETTRPADCKLRTLLTALFASKASRPILRQLREDSDFGDEWPKDILTEVAVEIVSSMEAKEVARLLLEWRDKIEKSKL